ncbi:hypothetical protein [Aestuariivirga sp.]|uniref:hypothetical protein n=1 Tax=Aestuariivirga sp. TaxID=2650926 RepID=UPI00391AB57D
MTKLKHILTTVAYVFGVGTVAGATSAVFESGTAYAAYSEQEVERACRKALEENTVEALEEFFYKYPPKLYRDTACYALALDAVRDRSQTSNPKGGGAGTGGNQGGGGYGG